jgi:hypothetical protein
MHIWQFCFMTVMAVPILGTAATIDDGQAVTVHAV